MRLGLDKDARQGDPRLGRALDRFASLLAGKGLRLTRARAAIVEAVLDRPGHFPIEELLVDLRRRGVRGSKATVYRALPLLAEAGILRAAGIGDDPRYEAAYGRDHHDHLVCRGCGVVVEFEDARIETLQREVAARHGFTLDAHQHQLVGRCPACRAQDGEPRREEPRARA